MKNTKPLYHYTSQKGLMGILENQNVWMTNILYLNDTSEFTHTIDLVKSELQNRLEHLSNIELPALYDWDKIDINQRKLIIYNDIDKYFDVSGSANRTENIYVFSLSQEKDDLSQWRGYCPKGVGFCIEFDIDKLSSNVKKRKYTLHKCIYDTKEKQDLIKSKFDALESRFELSDDNTSYFNDTRNYLKDDKASDEDLLLFFHYVSIMDVSSYIKHESFKDENEYRVVQRRTSIKILHREGNSMIIPYIEGVLVDDDNKLPISKIIVGPTPHPELSKFSVQSLLKSKNYDIDVECSKIPYRSW